MPTVLTREQIRAIDDRKIEMVKLPEWGEDTVLYVRSLSGKQRDAFELSQFKGKGRNTELNMVNLRARLIVLTAVDSDDVNTAELVFTENDAGWLGEKNVAPLQRLFAKAQELSAVGEDDIEDMVSELGNDLSDGSGSDSQDISDSPSPKRKLQSVATSSPSGGPTTG